MKRAKLNRRARWVRRHWFEIITLLAATYLIITSPWPSDIKPQIRYPDGSGIGA